MAEPVAQKPHDPTPRFGLVLPIVVFGGVLVACGFVLQHIHPEAPAHRQPAAAIEELAEADHHP